MKCQGALKKLVLVFLCATVLFGCQHESSRVDIFNFKLPIVTALNINKENNRTDLYKLNNSSLTKIYNANKIISLEYNEKNSVYAYLINKSKGNNLEENIISIETLNNHIVLDKSYTTVDIKLSPEGKRIAYRSFSKDNFNSAEGLKIYDINNNKKAIFKTKVLVSGQLYEWFDDENLLYYGVSQQDHIEDHVYKYNFMDNSEEIYLDNTGGICTFLKPVNKDDLLYLTTGISATKLYYFNKKNNEKKLLSSKMDEVFDAAYNLEEQMVYFIGKEAGNDAALYRISIKDFKIERITYDFPAQVDENGGIASDKDHGIYFCGLSNDDKNNIYMYDSSNKSINLVSSRQNNYLLISSE